LENNPPHLRRVLGLSDLSFFLVAALVNLNSVPVVAGAGPNAILFWLFGFTLFFIPQGIAVVELTSRFPQEGGIYQWSKRAFGEFHGFMSGWCYWANNIFYIPTLLFYMIGFAAFIGGEATAPLSDDPALLSLASLVLLWGITGLNIMGWGVGKWVQRLGVAGTVLTTAIVMAVGYIALQANGAPATDWAFDLSTVVADWRVLSLMSIVCLNYVGLELGSVLGDEIKEPRRSMPKAALIAGGVTVVIYVLATYALQLTIPAAEIGVIDGILQGVQKAVVDLGLPWLVVPIALLMTFNAVGNTSAWLAGSARIPFVIGLDRYLPSALARLHPRYATPHISLLVQGVASSLFILLNAIGATVHDMYLSLLQTTIILQLIPYLYMFAALFRFTINGQAALGESGHFRRPMILRWAATVGFVVTGGGVLLAFVPGTGIESVVSFEIKLFLGVFSFLLPAFAIYRIRGKRIALEAEPVMEAAAD
jgi:amino acid transporter